MFSFICFNCAIFQLHQISLGFFKYGKGDGLIHPFNSIELLVPLLCLQFHREVWGEKNLKASEP